MASDHFANEGERVETPADPFNKLVLNPAADEEASDNPLCPDCQEPIVPMANQHERRFVCGCDDNKQFSFDRSVDLNGPQEGSDAE